MRDDLIKGMTIQTTARITVYALRSDIRPARGVISPTVVCSENLKQHFRVLETIATNVRGMWAGNNLHTTADPDWAKLTRTQRVGWLRDQCDVWSSVAVTLEYNLDEVKAGE